MRMMRILLLLILLAATTRGRDAVVPLKMTAYYGYPSLVNGASGDVVAATNVFGRYNIVLFGTGLENTAHSDHAKTKLIIASLNQAGVSAYVGVSGQQSLAAAQTKILQAQTNLGATGVVFDDFDYIYVTRQTQNSLVNYAHGLGLKTAVLATEIADLLDPAIASPGNPPGDSTVLGSQDIAIIRGYQVRDSLYMTESEWIRQSAAALNFSSVYNVSCGAISTVSSSNALFSQSKYDYVFYSALAYGFTAMGWGEDMFASSSGAIPYRSTPDESINLGWAFTGDSVVHVSPDHYRYTTSGWAEINSYSHVGKFVWTVCKYNCSDHGICLNLGTTSASCLCDVTWNGAYCDVWWPAPILDDTQAGMAMGIHLGVTALLMLVVRLVEYRRTAEDEVSGSRRASTFSTPGTVVLPLEDPKSKPVALAFGEPHSPLVPNPKPAVAMQVIVLEEEEEVKPPPKPLSTASMGVAVVAPSATHDFPTEHTRPPRIMILDDTSDEEHSYYDDMPQADESDVDEAPAPRIPLVHGDKPRVPRQSYRQRRQR